MQTEFTRSSNTNETNKSKEEERIQEIDKRGGDKDGEEEAAT